MINTISIIALILSLTGNILINYKKKIGYIIWISSNIAWIVVNCLGYFNVAQVIMYVIYAALNIQGFVLWSRKNNNANEPKNITNVHNKCEFPDGMVIKPDGINELDPCMYEEVERWGNATVIVLKCAKCGHTEVTWKKQTNTIDLSELVE